MEALDDEEDAPDDELLDDVLDEEESLLADVDVEDALELFPEPDRESVR
ncbi:hypothetical protein [Isoptericola sp. NPDC055881]